MPCIVLTDGVELLVGLVRAPDWVRCCFPRPQQRLAAHLQPFLDAVNAQRLEEYELAAAAGEEPQRRNAYAERNQGRDLASRYAAWEEEQQQVPPLHTLLGWGEPVPVPGSRRSVWQVPSGRQATANGAAATDNGQWGCVVLGMRSEDGVLGPLLRSQRLAALLWPRESLQAR